MSKFERPSLLKHMSGVAMYMYEHAEDYGLDKELMFFVGLNHDI